MSEQDLPPSERKGRATQRAVARTLGISESLVGLVMASIVLASILAGGITGFFIGRWYEQQRLPILPAYDATYLIGASLDDQGDAVVVTDIILGGPASNAGIQEGDRLKVIEQQPISDARQAEKIIESYAVGDTLRLEIDRNHFIEQYSVTLGLYLFIEGPTVPPPPTPVVIIPPPQPQGSFGDARLGVYYRMLEPGDPFGVDDGALMITVWDGGPANLAGLSAGDIVLQVENQKLSQGYTLENALDNFAPGQTVRLYVLKTDGSEKTIRVTLGSG